MECSLEANLRVEDEFLSRILGTFFGIIEASYV